MTDIFLRLTSDSEPFYVKASKIDAVGTHPEWKPGNLGARSLVIIGGDQIQCDEKADSIIEALFAHVEVVATPDPHTDHVHYAPEQTTA